MYGPASFYRQVVLKIPGIAGGNTGTDFTFADQPDLRFARLQWMEFYTDQDLSHSQPEPTPLVAAALMPKISFVIQTNDPDIIPVPGSVQEKEEDNGRFTGTQDTIQWIPASALHVGQSLAGGQQASFRHYPMMWRNRFVLWQNTHVKFAPGGLGNTADVAIVLGCYYTFINAKGRAISPRN